MGESLPTDLTLEGFLSCVNPLVLLQVMFELEGLAAVTTFEFPQVRPVLVVGHVAHQLLQVGELLAAQIARLQGETWSDDCHCIAGTWLDICTVDIMSGS